MKTTGIVILFLLFVFAGCRKETREMALQSNDTTKLSLPMNEVKSFYSAQADTSGKQLNAIGRRSFLNRHHIDLSTAKPVIQGPHNWWVVPLTGQPTVGGQKYGYRKLAFYRDSTGRVSYRILEILPDVIYFQQNGAARTADFTGRIFVYNGNYQLLKGSVWIKGKMTGVIKPGKSGAGVDAARDVNPKARVDMVAVTAECGWYDDNYIDSEGDAAIYSEYDCSYTLYDDDEGLYGSGGGSANDIGGGGSDFAGGNISEGSSAPAVADLPQENNPAIDPKAYMNCFGSLPDIGSKCSVTIYVEEPAPGLPFNIGGNSVGHTAISLSKTYNGQTVTQTVGFYPNASGINKLHAQSRILDNSDLQYTVSITYQIIPQNFNQIVNFISNPPATYDLISYNCTNFAYDASKAGGITLPNPVGNMGLGLEGMTPAALGNSISTVAPVMNVNSNGGTVPVSHGPCN